MRLGEVVELVLVHIHAAGRDLVQQGLPQMAAVAVDQRDAGHAALAEAVAETGREFEPRGAAADDDDPVGR